jgi:hypothetical protein
MALSRRGFLGLAGIATAATFATRFPLFPRAEASPIAFPPPGLDPGKFIIKPLALGEPMEMALLRVAGPAEADLREVKHRSYQRVKAERIEIENGVATVIGTFPTCVHGHYVVRGAALYDKAGRLLFWKRFTGAFGEPTSIHMTVGQTLQATLSLTP